MSGRVHGGSDAHGVPRFDFSTNANACGPCPAALQAVRAAEVARYPDPAYTALRETLAHRHGVAPSQVVLAASGSEFIFRLTAWAAREGLGDVGVPRHGFGDYAAAARAWRLAVVDDAPAPLLWLCEPSSPLGQAETRWPWVAHARVAVLDMAYAPLRPDGVPSAGVPDVWQLWSPNKALGLAGVRGAYAVAPAGQEAVAADLDALAPSWPLGAQGVAMLSAWAQPGAQDWLAGSLETLRAWKREQQALCRGLGWQVLDSQANFFACVVHDIERVARLRGHGIKLRDCASFGLPGHARLSVQPPAAQDALRRAWEAAG